MRSKLDVVYGDKSEIEESANGNFEKDANPGLYFWLQLKNKLILNLYKFFFFCNKMSLNNFFLVIFDL